LYNIELGRGSEIIKRIFEIIRTWKFANKLVKIEQKFGYSHDVKRKIVSPMDLRSSFEINQGGMVGGDRMSPNYHGYAKIYARYLNKLHKQKLSTLNILEIGILTGTGLALWSQVFPFANIFGFDIDLSYYEKNRQNLIRLGAFKKHQPTVFEFDQYKPKLGLGNIPKFQIIIDDGVHTNEAIRETFNFLVNNDHIDRSVNSIYFIEDNATEYLNIAKTYQELNVINYGDITVITGFEKLRSLNQNV
jgi:hypothetical protein